MALVASWIETFKMPYHQIERTYRKSELAILGWRSAEIGHSMSPKGRQSQTRHDNPEQKQDNGQFGWSDETISDLERKLGPEISRKMVDDKGDVDLRRLTGAEAMHYLSCLGINMGRS